MCGGLFLVLKNRLNWMVINVWHRHQEELSCHEDRVLTLSINECAYYMSYHSSLEDDCIVNFDIAQFDIIII